MGLRTRPAKNVLSVTLRNANMSLEGFLLPVLASDAEGIWVLIPLGAFAMVVVIVKSVIKHRERMAKIGMGIDPDSDPAAPRTLTGQPYEPHV